MFCSPLGFVQFFYGFIGILLDFLIRRLFLQPKGNASEKDEHSDCYYQYKRSHFPVFLHDARIIGLSCQSVKQSRRQGTNIRYLSLWTTLV